MGDLAFRSTTATLDAKGIPFLVAYSTEPGKASLAVDVPNDPAIALPALVEMGALIIHELNRRGMLLLAVGIATDIGLGRHEGTLESRSAPTDLGTPPPRADGGATG